MTAGQKERGRQQFTIYVPKNNLVNNYPYIFWNKVRCESFQGNTAVLYVTLFTPRLIHTEGFTV